MLSNNIHAISIIVSLFISFSSGAPIDDDPSSGQSLIPSDDVFHDYLDKSIFCHKNEVVRRDGQNEQYCFNHPLVQQDEIDTKSACMCANGYVRHVDGFCSTQNRCFIVNRLR